MFNTWENPFTKSNWMITQRVSAKWLSGPSQHWEKKLLIKFIPSRGTYWVRFRLALRKVLKFSPRNEWLIKSGALRLWIQSAECFNGARSWYEIHKTHYKKTVVIKVSNYLTAELFSKKFMEHKDVDGVYDVSLLMTHKRSDYELVNWFKSIQWKITTAISHSTERTMGYIDVENPIWALLKQSLKFHARKKSGGENYEQLKLKSIKHHHQSRGFLQFLMSVMQHFTITKKTLISCFLISQKFSRKLV